MDNNYYRGAKESLKNFADGLQNDDIPARRQDLNDFTDYLIRELAQNRLKEKISLKQYNLYVSWLTSYCVIRHNK